MYYKINSKTPEQLRRIIKKCVRQGENYIAVDEMYNEKKDIKFWEPEYKIFSITATTYKPDSGFGFRPTVTYFPSTKKDEFNDSFGHFQSSCCRAFTGMKFEFEWEESETVEQFVQNHPYNESYD